MERLMMWRSTSNKKVPKMADSVNNSVVEDDVSSWEIINPFDEDQVESEDGFSYDDGDLNDENGIDGNEVKIPSSVDERRGFDGAGHEDERNDDERSGFDDRNDDDDSDVRMGGHEYQSLDENTVPRLVISQLDNSTREEGEPMPMSSSLVDQLRGFAESNAGNSGGRWGSDDYNDEDIDDDDDDCGGLNYDFDDHLVPFSVSNRFGKQRLTKMGTKNSPKKNKFKRMPRYYYNRVV